MKRSIFTFSIFTLSVVEGLLSAFCLCWGLAPSVADGQTTHNLEIIFQRGIPDTSLRYWGAAIAGVGDVNGDGYDDVAVGAYKRNGIDWDAKIYVFNGSATFDTIPDHILTDWSGGTNNQAVCGGDINGDGYGDVIIVTGGRAYIHYGSAAGPSITPNIRFGGRLFESFTSVATGCLNGDDTTDLIVGDYWNRNGHGHVNIYLGSAHFDTIPWLVIRGKDYEQMGSSLSANADLNGDGINDLAVGAATHSVDSRGRLYAFWGGAAMDTLPDWWKDGEGPGQYWGEMSVSTVKLNGEYGRYWSGSMYYPGGYGTSQQNGKSVLFYGGTIPDSIPDMEIIGADPFSNLGSAFASAFFDSNSFGDLVCGATEPTGAGLGRCWTSKIVQDTTVNAWLMGRWNDDRLGVINANAGDVDGDAIDEVMFGSWAETNRLVVICKYTGPNGTNTSITNDELPHINIFQIHPNPFKQKTTIRYQIPTPGRVSLKVYNIAGQLVRTVFNGLNVSGSHVLIWDGLDEMGKTASSGVYFCHLQAVDVNIVKKMAIIR